MSAVPSELIAAHRDCADRRPCSSSKPAPRLNFTLYDAGGQHGRVPQSERSPVDRPRFLEHDLHALPAEDPRPDRSAKPLRQLCRSGRIACDDQPWPPAAKKAVEGIKDYYLRKAQKPINYGVWFEVEGQEGRVQAQFKIKAYPTMIMLDHSGRELWRGSDVRQLEESIKYCLMRK